MRRRLTTKRFIVKRHYLKTPRVATITFEEIDAYRLSRGYEEELFAVEYLGVTLRTWYRWKAGTVVISRQTCRLIETCRVMTEFYMDPDPVQRKDTFREQVRNFVHTLKEWHPDKKNKKELVKLAVEEIWDVLKNG